MILELIFTGLASIPIIRFKNRLVEFYKNEIYITDKGYYYEVQEEMSNKQTIILQFQKVNKELYYVGFYKDKGILSYKLLLIYDWSYFMNWRLNWNYFYKNLNQIEKQYIDKYLTMDKVSIDSLISSSFH